MGRIYQEAETVIVWLGQISNLAELCIAALDERGEAEKISLPAQSPTHEDHINTGGTNGIILKYHHAAMIGATAVILSQWYAEIKPNTSLGMD